MNHLSKPQSLTATRFEQYRSNYEEIKDWQPEEITQTDKRRFARDINDADTELQVRVVSETDMEQRYRWVNEADKERREKAVRNTSIEQRERDVREADSGTETFRYTRHRNKDDKAMARRIMAILCDELAYKREPEQTNISVLMQMPGLGLSSTDQQLYTFLKQFPLAFEMTYRGDYNESRIVYVRPKIGATLCLEYANDRSCSGCDQIHICRFFLKGDGKCKFGKKCHFSHEFCTVHNFPILRDHLLDKVSNRSLRAVLQMYNDHTPAHDSTSELSTCKFYNSGKTGCTKPDCSFLHVCQHYIMGDCKFGVRCKRIHDLTRKATLNILRKHGISGHHSQLLQLVRNKMINKTKDYSSAKYGAVSRSV